MLSIGSCEGVFEKFETCQFVFLGFYLSSRWSGAISLTERTKFGIYNFDVTRCFCGFCGFSGYQDFDFSARPRILRRRSFCLRKFDTTISTRAIFYLSLCWTFYGTFICTELGSYNCTSDIWIGLRSSHVRWRWTAATIWDTTILIQWGVAPFYSMHDRIYCSS